MQLSRISHRVPRRVRDVLRPPVPSAARPWVQHSFAQAGEDRVVRFLFDALGIDRPSYLDIGAYHPFHLSNTALFHLAGSRGVNVDPDPDAVAALRRHRPEDVTLNIGIGPEPGDLTFHRMSLPSLSTFDADVAAETERASGGAHHVVATVTVRVRTMADVLGEVGRCPDFLSLDAEGLDLAILRTMPQWPGRPLVVCVETVRCAGDMAAATREAEIPGLMAELGYLRHAETWANGVFVDEARWAHVG